MNCARTWIVLGGVLACLSVVFGAFGAHGLEGTLKEIYGDATKEIAGMEFPATYKYLQDFNTGARYQMYNALGLIALGILASNPTTTSQRVSAWSFLVGTLLFSGSLYVLVLTKLTILGLVAAIGGTFMIIAWVAFVIGCCQKKGEAEGAAT
jgi:uncharacterized membrane protein YgdD (TMEM256/DUF423 family)